MASGILCPMWVDQRRSQDICSEAKANCIPLGEFSKWNSIYCNESGVVLRNGDVPEIGLNLRSIAEYQTDISRTHSSLNERLGLP
jgi:hypothetical protein